MTGTNQDGPARLAQSSWPEIDHEQAPVLLVPLGSCEQHGPHLPLDTDTRIARAVAAGAGEGTLVAPALGYGASGEHQDFPGTVSIGHEALRFLLVEFGRSACRWARRLVFVSGHGGNGPALASAVRLLRYEGREVAWFPCATSAGDAHAGWSETALLLAIDPDAVHGERAAPGNTAPLAELLPRLREGALRELAPNGVLGDPTGATAEQGRELLGEMTAALRRTLAEWVPDESGRLR